MGCCLEDGLPGLGYVVRITPHFYKPWSERPFGRGPTILLRGQQRSPWLLTTYPSPGMILQVMGDYLIELQVNLDDGNFAKRNSKMLGSFNFGPIFWEGIKLDAHVFWLLRKFLALFSIGKQWKKTQRTETAPSTSQPCNGEVRWGFC